MVELKQNALLIAFYILTILTMVNCECSTKIMNLSNSKWNCPVEYTKYKEIAKSDKTFNYINCRNLNFTEEKLSYDFEFIEITNSIISTLEPFKHACVLNLSNITMNISNTHELNNSYLSHLSLRFSNLTTFDLLPIPSLSILDLSNNALTSLNTTNFRNFKLNILNVSSNRLSDIYCENVALVFDLSNNGLEIINCKFAQTLKYVLLNNNNLRNISMTAFKDMQNLVSLKLNNNQLDEVAHIFNGLQRLIYLNMSNNNIYRIRFGCFTDLISLIYLDLSYNKIDSLPQGIFHGLDLLKVLDLSYNDIFVFNVYFLHGLNELYLEGNLLQDLDLKNLSQDLTKISFSFADISCHKLKEYVDILENEYVEIKNGTYLYVDNVNGIKCNARNTTELYKFSIESSLNSLKEVHLTLTMIVICFLVIIVMFAVIQYCRYKM